MSNRPVPQAADPDCCAGFLPPVRSLKGPEYAVILIGNGPTATSKRIGDSIDTYHRVVRLNNWRTVGFEEYVGRKTHVWIRAASRFKAIPDRTALPEELEKVVIAPSWNLPGNVRRVMNYYRKRASFSPWDLELVKKEQLDSLRRFAGPPYKHKLQPSTGSIALWWLLHRYSRVMVHGFDHFKGGHDREHYFDRPWKPGSKRRKRGVHSSRAEEALFTKLEKAGRIVRL